MKKLLIAALCILAVGACKEDDPVVTNGYPTDGLTLEPKQNSLLMMGYEFQTNITATSERIRKIVNAEFDGRMHNISLVANSSSPFYNPQSDSLLMHFQSPSPPYFILNDMVLSSPTDLLMIDPEDPLLDKKPLASVSHAVSKGDTSWIVDCKVKFFEDTLVQPNALLIETYMTADVEARVFGAMGVDLRFVSASNFIKNTDSASFWDDNVYSLDSSEQVIKKGEPIIHQHLFLEKNGKEHVFGTPLSSYWPFSGDYHQGDIIGTADTPIRHHFGKPEKDEFTYNRKLRFVTVIWILDPVSSTYKYVNSYSTGKTY